MTSCKTDSERGLNPQQLEAVTCEGSALVLAGAGTGKTTVIVHRVAHAVAQGARPDSILLLTFTRRASREMLARAGQIMGRAALRVRGGTFHMVGQELLRRFGRAIGIEPNFTILDKPDAEDVIKVVRDGLGLHSKERRFMSKEVLGDLISKSRNKGLEITALLEIENPAFLPDAEDIERVSEGYAALKARRNLLDYDDLLFHTRDLLASRVGPGIAREFRHVLVDELQDVNSVQVEMVRGLCQASAVACGVGDDAQAIFTWRGASADSLAEFVTAFPEARQIVLEQNYRSTQAILDVANHVIRPARLVAPRNLRAVTPGGAMPTFVEVSDELAEADYIADSILASLEEGVPLSATAVIGRSMSSLRLLEAALTQRQIPYVVYGGIKFAEAAHVKDLIAILRWASNEADIVAMKRVLELLPGIGSATSQRIVDCAAAGVPLSDDDARLPARLKPQTAAALIELRLLLDQLRADGLAPAPAVSLARVFYEPLLRQKFSDDFARRLSDLDQVEMLAGNHRTLVGFLTDFALEPSRDKSQFDVRPRDEEDDVLVLSTIHSAKGLEFRNVFLIRLVDGAIPSTRSIGSSEAMEEERRLLYVAITRARENLVMTMPLLLLGVRPGDPMRGLAERTRLLDDDALALLGRPILEPAP